MSMPGWRRRSWSMALWPPLAAYLEKQTWKKYKLCFPSQSIIIIHWLRTWQKYKVWIPSQSMIIIHWLHTWKSIKCAFLLNQWLSSESKTSASCSDMRPVTPPGLRELTGWPLSSASLTFNLWSCEGSYYDSCDNVWGGQLPELLNVSPLADPPKCWQPTGAAVSLHGYRSPKYYVQRELFNSIWLTLGHPLIVEFLNNILCKKAFWTNIWKNKSICK